MACRLPSLSLRAGFLAGSNLFSLSSSGFRRRRFGTFCGCGLAWRGHESCCCSAFSEALPKHLFVGYQVFCCAKVSFQSPFCWVCLVAYRLPSLSLCALGSNLAAVPLFRMRFSMANFVFSICWNGCCLVLHNACRMQQRVISRLCEDTAKQTLQAISKLSRPYLTADLLSLIKKQHHYEHLATTGPLSRL